jgi:phosphocarrier protein
LRRDELNETGQANEIRGSFEVVNKLGMHARAATKLVQLACRFPCEIVVSHGPQSANAKSVMGVLLLCGSKGSRLDVVAQGDGAEDAVRQIGELIADRFGEEE